MAHYHKDVPSTHKGIRSAAHNPRSSGIAMPSVQQVIQRVEMISVNKAATQILIDPGKTAGTTYNWDSSFVIYIYNKPDETPKVRVVIYIATAASDSVFANWNEGIKSAWSNKFAIAANEKDNHKTYPISVEIIKSKPGQFKNYTVENVKQDKSLGVRGLFGTESMTKWGEDDPQDIPHEVGHMLGNKDEYGTVDGINWSAKHDVSRADTHSIMYKGDEPPRLRHFDLIFSEVQKSGFIPGAKLIKMGGATPAVTATRITAVTAPKKPSVAKDTGIKIGGATTAKPSTGPGTASYTSELGKSLHEKRVKDITAYIMENIGAMTAEQTRWFETHNWNTDWDLSATAKRMLNL